MCSAPRSLQDDEFFSVDGQVEVDETYIGGKTRIATGKTSKADVAQCTKTAVIAAISRKGISSAKLNRRYDPETPVAVCAPSGIGTVDLVSPMRGGLSKLTKRSTWHS